MSPELPLVLSLAPEALAKTPDFSPFRAGVEIARLYREGRGGSSAAFLRYAAGASVPLHRHLGYEHILVLEGAQHDERGRYEAARSSSIRRARGTACGARRAVRCSSSGSGRSSSCAKRVGQSVGKEPADTRASLIGHEDETPIPR